MTDLTYTGRCNCGGVRFEVDGPLDGHASYCHCTRCQRRTGAAASPQVRVEARAFRILAGEDLVREWAPPDGWPKCFCSVCGSALWSHDPESTVLGVRLGLFDTDPGVRPAFRQFVAYAAAWEPIPDDGLPQFPERRTA
jgi:hypothetical protein